MEAQEDNTLRAFYITWNEEWRAVCLEPKQFYRKEGEAMFGAKLRCCLWFCVLSVQSLFEVKTGHPWPSRVCIWVSIGLILHRWYSACACVCVGVCVCVCNHITRCVSQLLSWFGFQSAPFDPCNRVKLSLTPISFLFLCFLLTCMVLGALAYI